MPHCAPPLPQLPTPFCCQQAGPSPGSLPTASVPPTAAFGVRPRGLGQGCRVWGLHSLHLNGPSLLGPEVTAQLSSAEGAPCCAKHNTAWGIRGDKLERRG